MSLFDYCFTIEWERLTYSKEDDVLDQACNSEHIPRGPDPVWYEPIKNMDNEALDTVLSRYNRRELKKILGWEGAAQWEWHIRTALGYAIWRHNMGAVHLLVSKYGVDVKEDVCQNESSCCHYEGGIRFSSLAYCVEAQVHAPIAWLREAGATQDDFRPHRLFNFPGPVQIDGFWASGSPQVTAALAQTYVKKA